MNYLSVLVKLIIAIPQIKSMFDKLVDMYQQWQIDQIESKYDNKNTKRKALLNAIKEAKTDDERKALSIILHDINSGF